ncbi:MAG: LamG domain-containing protein [Lacipirellulaceae bacterium]
MVRKYLFRLLVVLVASALAEDTLAVVPTPTVGHWRFDDGAGSIATDFINGNDGVWDGGTGNNVWAAGIIGGGSQTNDENGGNGQEHFTIPSLSQLNGASGLTISIWFNQNVTDNNNSTYNALFMTRFMETSFGGGGENWGVALENNSAPRHIDWRVDGVSGGEFDLISGDPGWHHVAFTWDGTIGQRAIFLDGTELERVSAQTGTIINGGSWDIGNDTCCGNREFTGTLDDLAVWDTALPASTITEIYFNGLSGVNASSENPPLRGDVDLDGDVDFDETDNDGISDLDIIQANFDMFTTGAFRTDGDLTADGVVNFDDLVEWRRGFVLNGGNLEALANRVPEPNACLIMICSGLLALSRASRSRH